MDLRLKDIGIPSGFCRHIIGAKIKIAQVRIESNEGWNADHRCALGRFPFFPIQLNFLDKLGPITAAIIRRITSSSVLPPITARYVTLKLHS